MAMNTLTRITLALALIALVCGCGTKQEAPKSDDNKNEIII